MISRFLWVIACYLSGSIPSGYWIVRLVRGIDIRDYGSGNIGFTNVLRTCGPWLGVPVFLLDIAKGAVPVFLVIRLMPGQSLLHVLCGAACLAGHSWSCFLGFRGGKIVSTSLGVFLILKWEAVVISAVIFLIVFGSTRVVSLGALVAAVTLIVVETVELLWLPAWSPTREIYVFSLLAVVLVFVKHRSNIKRLLSGEEKKLSVGESKS